jgi:hypothetical protein
MKRQHRGERRRIACLLVLTGTCWQATLADPANGDPQTVADTTGLVRTFAAGGDIDTSGAFFQSIGTNGRSCNSCHRIEDGWTISPPSLQARFAASKGTDPVFRPVDGSNSPLADVSTLAARQVAYSMLLDKAVIRVGLPILPTAEFSLAAVDDPYKFASAAELSLFRRPLPSTNLRFITAAMWDGRETHAPFALPMDVGADASDLAASLTGQAHNATMGHAQASVPPSAEQLRQIVDFELALSTAQVYDNQAGWLNSDDALGGPRMLAHQLFYIGINDCSGPIPRLPPSCRRRCACTTPGCRRTAMPAARRAPPSRAARRCSAASRSRSPASAGSTTHSACR